MNDETPDSDSASVQDAEAATRIALLRVLAAETPDDATTWFLLGRELLSHGHATGATAAFESAIHAQPDYAAAYRQLGNAQEAAGLADAAVETYRRGVEVAARTNDLQAGKEMNAFLTRLARDRPRP